MKDNLVNESGGLVNDCISRQAAIDALGDMVMNWTDSDYELGQLNQWKEDRKAIIDLPSAQPQQTCEYWDSESKFCALCRPSAQPVRKTGQWIKRKKGAIGYNCSCCGKSDISNHFDYCPNCGADMRGEQDE